MRPAGEISQALVKAARELMSVCAGATLAEIAEKACVGRAAARVHIAKLKCRGHLKIVGERRVSYRNRPVAEYAPVQAEAFESDQAMSGSALLGSCLQGWMR